MVRREGKQSVKPVQRGFMLVTRIFGCSQVDIGIGQMGVVLNRTATAVQGVVIFALLVEQVGQVGIGFRIVGPQCQGLFPMVPRPGKIAQAAQGIAQVVMRLGVPRFQRDDLFRQAKLSSSLPISCKTMPRLFHALVIRGSRVTACRPICSASTSSPTWRSISVRLLKATAGASGDWHAWRRQFIAFW